MHYNKLILLLCFLFQLINAKAQLKANAGNDIMVCYPASADARIQLGGNPVASGGVEPYKYTWSGRQVKYTSPKDSAWVYASEFLNDTTISNPSFKSMDAPEKWASFYLKVEDTAGNMAYDTVRVIDAFITSGGNYMQPVTIQKGDSVHFFGMNHIFHSNFPLQYSITPTNGLKDPTDFNGWAKPDTTITYYIRAVNSAGCETETYYLKVNIENTNAVQLVNDNDIIKVYPNPISSDLFIEGNFTEKEYTLELYSIKGELIKTACFLGGNNSFRMDMRTVKSGSYIIRIISEGKYGSNGKVGGAIL